MLALLQRALEENRTEAWAELFVLVEEVSIVLIRHRLIGWGYGNHDVEDAVMDFWLSLYVDDQRRLRSFRGSHERQFRTWLTQSSDYFAQNWVDHHVRAARRAAHAFREIRLARENGPHNEQVGQLLEQLEAVASQTDLIRIRILAGLQIPESPLSERTERRWRADLREKYRPKLKGRSSPPHT